MNLILLGAPGAGKGTQAELLTQKLGIPAISTGNMLREAMRNDTETGRKVTYYMDNGLLVPDDVILAIVRDRVSCPDCARGFILDGDKYSENCKNISFDTIEEYCKKLIKIYE